MCCNASRNVSCYFLAGCMPLHIKKLFAMVRGVIKISPCLDIFIGGAYGVRLGAHIGVEAFTLLLPKKAQKALNIIVMIACLILCAVICKFGFEIVQTQLSKNQLSPCYAYSNGLYVCSYSCRYDFLYNQIRSGYY